MKPILTLTLPTALAVQLSAAQAERFITHPLDIEIESFDHRGGNARPSEAHHEPESLPADQDPAGNWGEPSGGLQLSIRFDKEKYAPDQPIFMTVLLRNITEAEINTSISSTSAYGDLLGANLDVTNSKGESVMTRAEAQSKSAFSRRLQKVIVRAGIIPIPDGYQRRRVDDLRRIYSLEPGRYSVTATRNIYSPDGLERFEIKTKPAILLITDRFGTIPEAISTVRDTQPAPNYRGDSGETNAAPQNQTAPSNQETNMPSEEAASAPGRSAVPIIVSTGLIFGILLFAWLKRKRGEI